MVKHEDLAGHEVWHGGDSGGLLGLGEVGDQWIVGGREGHHLVALLVDSSISMLPPAQQSDLLARRVLSRRRSGPAAPR